MESTNRGNNTNKTFWFLIVLCFCITAPSCGIFKKHIKQSSEKTESSSEIREESRKTNIDTTARDLSEFIKLSFTFRKPEFPQEKDRQKGPVSSDQPESEKKDFDAVMMDQLTDLLSRTENLDIEIFKHETEQKGISSNEEKTTDKKESSKSEIKQKQKEKDGNTTLAANIPWFAWIIGALLIFGIVVYLVKQFKPI